MLLTSVETLRTRLNQRDTNAINTQLAAILTSVTYYMEGVLGTSFLYQEGKEDLFHLDANTHLTNLSYCRLRLAHACVSKVELMNDYGIQFRTDEDTGIVTLLNNWAKGDDLTVKYTKGFQTEQDSYGNSVYQNVPEWLSTATLVWAEAIFFSKFGDSEDIGNDSDYTTPPDGVSKILANYDRYMPSAIRAIV